MQLRRPLAWPVIAQIVDVHAIDDVRNASRASHFIEPCEQFVLAVEAAAAIVLDVIGPVELIRLQNFQRDVVLACKGNRVFQLKSSQTGRVCDQRQHV